MKKAILLLLVLTLLPLYGCGAKQTGSNGELTIATLRENEFLKSAAAKYEETHEGAKINIITYWEGGDENMDVSKYSQIINTSLMSGRGEDIIDVSSLTWTKLADTNKLLDLNGLLNLDPETYYMSVMDAFLYNNKRYTIPLCFSFEALKFYDDYADKETPADLTIDDLIELAGVYPEAHLFDGSGFGMDQTSLAFRLFGLNFNSFLDIENKEANIDNVNFISMLEKVSSLSEPLAGSPAVLSQRLVYSPAMTSGGTEDLSDMFLLTNEAGQALYSTVGFMPAVNAGSANKKLAVDFIQFLISKETMISPEMYFCPVNKNAVAERARLTYESVTADAEAAEWIPEGFDLEENIKAFNKLTERLAVIESSDSFINGFVYEDIERFFQGNQNAEQTAKNIQSRLNTYLNE
jgi:multiple sugar transport system substrate-binding protein